MVFMFQNVIKMHKSHFSTEYSGAGNI